MAAAEVAAEPWRALVDGIAMPLLVAMDPPWEARQSPGWVYKRRAPGGWLTGGSAPAQAPAQPAPAAPTIEEVNPDA